MMSHPRPAEAAPDGARRTRRRARATCAPDPPSGRPEGAGPHGARARVRCHGVVGNLDVAVDDLLPEVVDLVLDVVDEATGRGQADAVALEVVDDVGAALDVAVDELADEGLHRVVHALEHRGHDHGLQRRVVDRLVLVGVDTDRPRAGRGSGLEDTGAGTAGDLEDDVGTGLVHALRRGSARGPGR